MKQFDIYGNEVDFEEASGIKKSKDITDAELLEQIIIHIDLMYHGKQYRFRNKDGTYYSREACRDLTKQEVLEEIVEELCVINKILEDDRP